ncbi:MAG: C45 family autoproteolytic acyltransferase/hydrolase [Bacteroidota bacterium]
MPILRTIITLADRFLLVLLLLMLVFIYKVRIPVPVSPELAGKPMYKRIKVAENHYRIKNCWIRKNDHGVWEMYLEGSPYERGLIYGILARETVISQEEAFTGQINELIPSVFMQHFLQGFIAWFNRDMDEYVPEENLQEIYGISRSFSDQFNYIGPKFYRILYYHAAHDIGHALADLRIVGCTSFAVKDGYTSDGKLLVGRNFDFYMGDEFARDKLLLFVKPDSGHAFTTYSWAGFTGVVSGMNDARITVTINASKSEIPLSAKTPISLLAREIVQYAGNIEEAVAIARKRKVFVSESILIGSAKDHASVIIEKGPGKMDVYRNDKPLMVCSNHYQGAAFVNDTENRENIKFTDSAKRFQRMKELIGEHYPLDPVSAAGILRDRNGLGDQPIGNGNPLAVNQLIAHHSIIFQPEDGKFWISTGPWQLGEYLGYNLNSMITAAQSGGVAIIPADTFLNTTGYDRFLEFRSLKHRLVKSVLFQQDITLTQHEIDRFIASNPESYEVYNNLGKYYQQKKMNKKASEMYAKALKCEVASLAEQQSILEALKQTRTL